MFSRVVRCWSIVDYTFIYTFEDFTMSEKYYGWYYEFGEYDPEHAPEEFVGMVYRIQNLDTNQIYKFSDHDNLHGSIADGASLLQNADLLVGHNIIGFDNVVMDKLCGTTLNEKRLHDTWVMSQVLRYKRGHKHGLAGWGQHLEYPKFSFEDWSGFSDEMMTYCVRDVQLNTVIFKKLMEELERLAKPQPLIREGIKSEMEAAKFDAYCRYYGWEFDTTNALKLLDKIKLRMSVIENNIDLAKPAYIKEQIEQAVDFALDAPLPPDSELMVDILAGSEGTHGR